jgi:hypothetical protein
MFFSVSLYTSQQLLAQAAFKVGVCDVRKNGPKLHGVQRLILVFEVDPESVVVGLRFIFFGMPGKGFKEGSGFKASVPHQIDEGMPKGVKFLVVRLTVLQSLADTDVKKVPTLWGAFARHASKKR